MTQVARATRQLLRPLLRREPGETFGRNCVRALARLYRSGSSCCKPNCVNKSVSIAFRVARWSPGKLASYAPHWAAQRRSREPIDWIAAIRLGEGNKALLDYVLLPAGSITGSLTRFSETARVRRGIDRFETFPALVRSLIRRVTMASRASPATSPPPRRPRQKGRSRTATRRREPEVPRPRRCPPQMRSIPTATTPASGFTSRRFSAIMAP